MTKTYKHWKLDTDQDHILWLTLDRADTSVNSLNREVISELDNVLDDVANDSSLKGVILRSGKAKGFIAGADITQFTQFESVKQAEDLVRQAQIVFDKLEALKIPTVAVIDGFCLGGGTELVLACDYRIADIDAAKIGLPEVKLGIHPGWGGTIRLPRLIGVLPAMDLILSGRAVSARSAKRLGIVNAATPKRHLERAARHFVLKRPPKRKPGLAHYMASVSFMRPLVGKLFYKKLSQKIRRDHYPAPFKVVDLWIKDGAAAGDKAMINEAKSIANLFLTDTAQNLVRVFFLQEKMKSLAKVSDFKAKHVHVIGAGTMGGDIAAWCALRGMRVTLQDREPKFIAPAIKRAAKLFKEKLKAPHLVKGAMDRLMPDVEGLGVLGADVIIEAVFENLEVKQQIFKTLEEKAKPSAILATNTSSIPLDEINTALKNKERLVGIHFFNPVAKMQLVEVVHGQHTSEKIKNDSTAFVGQISRLPLPVKSSPGFLVNRVLMPYLMECMQLLDEKVKPQTLDKLSVDFGMPMGPVELADTVGLDVCLSVAENLSSHYGGSVPESLKKMVEKGDLGRKTGKGFYKYIKGKAQKPKASNKIENKEDITDRLILRMVNEAVACLREGVVENADFLDGGMIFGTGFAPFRGGPMHYVQTRGVDDTKKRLEALKEQYGERFTPDAGWAKLDNFLAS